MFEKTKYWINLIVNLKIENSNYQNGWKYFCWNGKQYLERKPTCKNFLSFRLKYDLRESDAFWCNFGAHVFFGRNIESNMGNNSTLVTLISFWNLNLDTQSDLTICTKLRINQHNVSIDLSSKISSTTATIDFLLYFETNRNSAPLVDNPRTKQFEWLIKYSIWHWWPLVYFHDQQWQPIVSGTSRIVIIEWTAFRCSKLSQPQSYRTGMNFWQSNRDHRKTLKERERERERIAEKICALKFTEKRLKRWLLRRFAMNLKITNIWEIISKFEYKNENSVN